MVEARRAGATAWPVVTVQIQQSLGWSWGLGKGSGSALCRQLRAGGPSPNLGDTCLSHPRCGSISTKDKSLIHTSRLGNSEVWAVGPRSGALFLLQRRLTVA